MGTLGNIKVEPCKVLWAGTDLGFTDGDLEVSPEEAGVEITAHQEGTNVLDMIRTGKKVELSVTLKETSAAQLRTMLEAGGGATATVAQVATLTCVADVSSSLHGKSFVLVAKDGTKHYFQLKTGTLAAPTIPGYSVHQITIAANDSANTVADAVSAAIDALSAFAAPNPAAAAITVTWSDAGAVPTGSTEGDTGFTFAVGTTGTTLLSGWGKSQDFTSMLGDAGKLVLHPVANDDAVYTGDLNFWKAYPMLSSIVQSGENPKTVAITFKIFPDMTKPDAIRLFAFGDGSGY
jgi:hypothetical protein